MDELRESPADEAARLRGCLNDLVSITALPALWTGAGPRHVARTLLDALGEMLGPGFVFVRLEGDPPVEIVRAGPPLERAATARTVGAMLDEALGPPSHWPASAHLGGFRVACAPLGVQGELGVLVAGCERPGFPEPAERLLLDVAANQAALGLQQASLLGEQERIARALDVRVAERTRELAEANQRRSAEAAELARAREDLDRVANNLVRFLDAFPGYVVTMSPAGQVEHLNREVLDYFGKTAGELRDWAMTDAVHPDDLPWVVETLGRHLAAGTPYDVEHRCRRADGVYRWFQVRSHPVRDPDGGITGWYVVLTDIDDRKRAEQALRASERNLKLTIGTVPALVWSALPDGTADFFNQHYLEFIGYTAEEAAGWGWTAAVHPDDMAGLAAVWMRSMATGERGEAEARMRRHDGEYVWFLFRTDPLRAERG